MSGGSSRALPLRVVVAAGGRTARATAGSDGRWTMVARLPEGDVTAKVTAEDAAGNATTRTRRLPVDTTAPSPGPPPHLSLRTIARS